VELRRVLQVARAYRYIEEADAAVVQGRYENAAAAYQMAVELAPEIAELKVWAAVALLHMGRDEKAMNLFQPAFVTDPGLIELERVCKLDARDVRCRDRRLCLTSLGFGIRWTASHDWSSMVQSSQQGA
jgi:tetratricopeptide (TPR) repeat protein